MGGNESKPLNTSNYKQSISLDKSSLYMGQDANFIKKVENPAYGEVKIYQDQRINYQWAVKQKTIDNTEDCMKYIQLCEKLMEIQHPYLVNILRVQRNTQSEYCASFFRVYMAYNYYKQTLKDQIKGKRNKKSPYSEKSLFKVIICINCALQFLNQHNITHDNITPSAILVDNEEKVYKISNIKFLTGTLTQYQGFLFGMKDQCYLSPQLFQGLKRREKNPDHNQEKSEIFSLGLCVLEAATFKDIQEIYDFEEFKMNETVLDSYIKIVEKNYTPKFHFMIKNMLLIDEEERLSYQNVQDLLNEYIKETGENQDLQNMAASGATHRRDNTFASYMMDKSAVQDRSMRQSAMLNYSGNNLNVHPGSFKKKLQNNFLNNSNDKNIKSSYIIQTKDQIHQLQQQQQDDIQNHKKQKMDEVLNSEESQRKRRISDNSQIQIEKSQPLHADDSLAMQVEMIKNNENPNNNNQPSIEVTPVKNNQVQKKLNSNNPQFEDNISSIKRDKQPSQSSVEPHRRYSSQQQQEQQQQLQLQKPKPTLDSHSPSRKNIYSPEQENLVTPIRQEQHINGTNSFTTDSNNNKLTFGEQTLQNKHSNIPVIAQPQNFKYIPHHFQTPNRMPDQQQQYQQEPQQQQDQQQYYSHQNPQNNFHSQLQKLKNEAQEQQSHIQQNLPTQKPHYRPSQSSFNDNDQNSIPSSTFQNRFIPSTKVHKNDLSHKRSASQSVPSSQESLQYKKNDSGSQNNNSSNGENFVKNPQNPEQVQNNFEQLKQHLEILEGRIEFMNNKYKAKNSQSNFFKNDNDAITMKNSQYLQQQQQYQSGKVRSSSNSLRSHQSYGLKDSRMGQQYQQQQQQGQMVGSKHSVQSGAGGHQPMVYPHYSQQARSSQQQYYK